MPKQLVTRGICVWSFSVEQERATDFDAYGLESRGPRKTLENVANSFNVAKIVENSALRTKCQQVYTHTQCMRKKRLRYVSLTSSNKLN